MPKIKVKGQTVQTNKWTHRRYQHIIAVDKYVAVVPHRPHIISYYCGPRPTV